MFMSAAMVFDGSSSCIPVTLGARRARKTTTGAAANDTRLRGNDGNIDISTHQREALGRPS
jgi:hypothetical protein